MNDPSVADRSRRSPLSLPARFHLLRRLRIAWRSVWRSYRLLLYAGHIGVLGGLGAQVLAGC